MVGWYVAASSAWKRRADDFVNEFAKLYSDESASLNRSKAPELQHWYTLFKLGLHRRHHRQCRHPQGLLPSSGTLTVDREPRVPLSSAVLSRVPAGSTPWWHHDEHY